MVQTAEYWPRSHWSFNRAQCRHRRLEAYCPVRPLPIVVLDKLGEHRPEVLLVEDDQVIQALAPERPDDSFGDGVHLRRQLPAVAVIRNDSV